MSALDSARRSCKGTAVDVILPDEVESAPDMIGPVTCRYRLNVPGGINGQGLFLPGLAAHARIEINGHAIIDSLRDAQQPLPRSLDRIVLVEVPDEMWGAGQNTVDIVAAGPDHFSLSRAYLGPLPEVRRRHHQRVLGVIVGPALVAAIVGTLGLCMLLLWRRRREGLHGYFAAGNLGWALHTLWTVLPWSLLSGPHHTVWWTTLYTFFVTMLIIFCIRFADWRWPLLERGLWAIAAAAPVVLYASVLAGSLSIVAELLRLLLVGLVGLGSVAVARAAFAKPDVNRLLILASGVAAFICGAHDWLKDASDGGDNPVYWVPYAGLVFAVFVVRMLIDRFANVADQLEHLNVELGQRVASQNIELRETMERMRQARDAAETADLAKTRFLAAASHDLRQPAYALALYMAALRSERLTAGQADLVERMSGSLSALETMFNMLLDMSRMDAGALTPTVKVFAVEPLLRQLAEEFAPQAEAQGLRLALRLTSGPIAHVYSDPVLVARILRNLLANAIKYTARGGVLIACRLRCAARAHSSDGEPVRQWRIEVWDTGVGISDHHKKRVFEEFFQVDNPGRDRAKGMGLGLSIVQRLVGLLDLKLSLLSRPGRGSCFALHLPQAGVRGSAPTIMPVIAEAPVHGMTVGVIEDDVEVREAIRALLGRWGCAVVEGADAEELARHLHDSGRKSPPDALLVDFRLGGGKTGPTEARILFDRWVQAVDMLVVTGESELGDISAAGFNCLAKPVSAVLLRNWLASIRMGSAAPAAPSSLSPERGAAT